MDDNNWELCKENVLPLKQGRKVSQLNKILSMDKNSNEIKERSRKRDEYEGLLRNDLEDPLSIWYEYILWIEQNYPEGGEEANLTKVIESCISELFNQTKYHEDERFFEIFLKYIKIVKDPFEVFNMVHNANIFLSIASFYVYWSFYAKKNYKRSEKIIQLGFDNLAQPRQILEIVLSQIKSDMEKNANDSSEEEETYVRKPFVPLKCLKKKSGKVLAPVERLANYDQKSYKLASTVSKIENNKMIKIFNDENDVNKPLTKEVSKLNMNNQENDNKAEKWCDNRIKSKVKTDNIPRVDFEVLEDDETNSKEKKNNDRNKMFGALKPIKKEESNPRLFIHETLKPNQKFFADLKKIYCGGTEFSFEEIRIRRIKHLKKREQDEIIKKNLEKEAAELKKRILTKKNDFNETLINDVERLKNELDLLLKKKEQKNLDQVELKNKFPNVQKSFDENQENTKNLIETSKDLTIVRNLWNGTLNEDTTCNVDKVVNKPKPIIEHKDFSIFKDTEDDIKSDKEVIKKLKLENQMLPPQQVLSENTYFDANAQFLDMKTIELPLNEFDFVAKYASTPAAFKQNKLEQSYINDRYIENGKLSPIVETSKEYKSSSSSSSSGINSTYKFKTFRNS